MKALFRVRSKRLALWLSSIPFLLFIRITRELMEGDVAAVDQAILDAVGAKRTPWLTGSAVDVTALGSVTLVVLFSAFTLVLLLLLRDRRGALQLLAASAGAAILTIVTKDIFERIRPEQAQQLVVVSGFSYPSGHSVSTAALYLTIAIIAGRHVQRGARTAIFVAAAGVILMVGASRVYLGVHYATDVVSGISLGTAWALLLAGFFTETNGASS